MKVDHIQEQVHMNMAGLIIGILISAVISGFLIWIEGWLGLGLTVSGPIPAFLAGCAIAVVGGVVTWLLSLRGLKITNGLLRAAVNVLLGAVVLLIAGQFIADLTVDGFSGALLASVVIGIVSWLLSLILRRVNQAAAQEQETGQLS